MSISRRGFLRAAAGIAGGTVLGRQLPAGAVDLAAGAPRRTFATSGAIARLAVAGDVGTGDIGEVRTGQAMARYGTYDALLLLGDNVYPNGDPKHLGRTVWGPFGDVLKHADLYAILGNHDVKQHHGDAQLKEMGITKNYFAKDFGPMLLVGLDATTIDDKAQAAFLDKTLAGSSADFKVVAVHYPPYSGGEHGSYDTVRNVVSPLCEKHGVKLVLSGHDHDYQRSRVINGVTYVVSGAGALDRRTGRAGFMEAAEGTKHFVDLALYSDRLELRAVDQSGRLLDGTTLRR